MGQSQELRKTWDSGAPPGEENPDRTKRLPSPKISGSHQVCQVEYLNGYGPETAGLLPCFPVLNRGFLLWLSTLDIWILGSLSF